MRGLVVSLNTPFDASGQVDFPAIERLVHFHLTEGATGFLVCAQAAEVLCLSIDERLQIVRTVRDVSRGRGLLVAGVSAESVEDSTLLAKAAAVAGCDGILAEPPTHYPRSASILLPFFRAIAAAGPPLLMIQDLDWSGPGMPLPLIIELFAAIPQFRWLKVEAAPAGPKYTAVLEATGGQLNVCGGWAALQMLEALDRGVEVFMNTALTRFYKSVFHAWESGEHALAVSRFRDILPVLAFTRQHLDVSVRFHKELFAHLGIFATANVRKIGVVWDQYYERQTHALLEYIDNLYAQQVESPVATQR